MRGLADGGKGLEAVRPEVLRRYYAATFGTTALPAEAFEGATFDEYCELMRISFPAISRYQAAKGSKTFRDLAPGLKAEHDAAQAAAKSVPAARPHRVEFRNRPVVDLAAEVADAAAESLLLDRIAIVRGFASLSGLGKLRRLRLILCGTDENAAPEAAFHAGEVDLSECTQALLARLLPSVRSPHVRIAHLDAPWVELSLLRENRELSRLICDYGFVRGFAALRGYPLSYVSLPDLAVDAPFLGALASWAPSLEELRLGVRRPFAPDRLPDLPCLERLTLPAYPEQREAWIGFALSRPGVRCRFPPLPEPSAKGPAARVAAIHRGCALLEIAGSRPAYEVEADFAGLAADPGAAGNHALRDRLEGWAAARRLEAEFASEADGIRIRAAGIETLKRCIDALLDGQA